jgi:hypothetical protein
MEHFAKQSYYDEIIAAAMAMGYRFMAQVNVTTDDMPFYIEVKYARVTCLTFDIPGKAMFAHFYHNEHFGMFGGGYANHWNILVEYDYGDYSDLLNKFIALNGKYDEEAFEHLKKSISTFELENLQSGWHSSSNYFQLTFTGDVREHAQKDLCPASHVTSVLGQIKSRSLEYAKDVFHELSMAWAPAYVFTGPQNLGYMERDKLRAKLDDLFWDRFGGSRNIIREKVKRTF